jgi:formylglycine-generating enzyme required for sulfatase activity
MTKHSILIILGAVFVLILCFRNAPATKPAPRPAMSEIPVVRDIPVVKPPETEKKCPDGFVRVPGNPLYKTDDFCVMKYEAKCALASDPSTGIRPVHGDACDGEKSGHFFGTYRNNGPGCACTNERRVVSVPSGYPIAYIPQSDGTADNAEKYCANQGWHSITNDEWMTIARNVEQVESNWCDKDGTHCGCTPGTVGKVLANGHYDSNNEATAGGATFDSALVAGADDQPCYGTTTDGSNECGGKGAQKRTLALSNGETIWDLAGNVWEWVGGTVARKDEPRSETNGKKDIGWLKSDFAPGSLPSVITDDGQGSSMGYDAFRPSNPAWNATNGVGRIYHYSSVGPDTDTTRYGFIRGGNWKHGADDGAFTIHLSPPPNRKDINDVGFRCVAPLE